MIHPEEIDKAEREFRLSLLKGIKVARQNGMKLSKFKEEINLRLQTKNNEDQWTFDYEAYLCCISNGIYQTPTEWGRDFYYDRWR